MLSLLVSLSAPFCAWTVLWRGKLRSHRGRGRGEKRSATVKAVHSCWAAVKGVHYVNSRKSSLYQSISILFFCEGTCKVGGGGQLLNVSLNPKYRAKQSLNDFCPFDDMLFCKFCQNTVDWKSVDWSKDYLWSKVSVKSAAAANVSQAAIKWTVSVCSF